MDALKNGWLSGSYHTKPPLSQNRCSSKIFSSNHHCSWMVSAAFKFVPHPYDLCLLFCIYSILLWYTSTSTGMRRVRSFDQSSWRVYTVYQTFNICLPFYFKGSASQKFWTPYFCLKFISAGPWYTNQLFNVCILLIFCYIRAQMSSFHWPKFR